MRRDPISFIVFATVVCGLVEGCWLDGSVVDVIRVAATAAVLAWTLTLIDRRTAR